MKEQSASEIQLSEHSDNSLKRVFGAIRRIVYNDRVGSLTGAAFFTFWIGQRYYFADSHSFLWWLVTIQFSLFVIAYVTRRKAREHARGFKETVFPFICAATPFALDSYPYIKPYSGPLVDYPAIYMGLMIVGSLIITAGVFSLRRSFSIMTEVREPVFEGIYLLSRHPMYLGSLAGSLGVVFYNFSFLNVLIFVFFCVIQIYRAGLEEQKISAVFPEYAEYANRVGWLWIIGRWKYTGDTGNGGVRDGTDKGR